jgi:hypothetical protein
MKNTYEDRLLTELRQVVTENPAPVTPSRRFGWKPRLVIGGVAAALVAAGAVAVVETSATPAFAVTPNKDGSVTVTINKLSDAEGLQRELIAAGVPTVAKYLPIGKTCAPDWYKPAQAGPTSMKMTLTDGHLTFTISRHQLRKGQTLIISTQNGVGTGPGGEQAEMSAVGMGVAQGPVGVCHVVDAKLPPPGQPGAGGGSVHTDGPDAGTSAGPTLTTN